MSALDPLRDALRCVAGQLVALDQRHAPMLTNIVAELAQGIDVSDQTLKGLGRGEFESFSFRSAPQMVPLAGGSGKSLAIVSVKGLALYELDFPPYAFSTRVLAQTLTELSEDRSVGAIVLDLNTPGGQVTGTPEASDAVWAVAKRKPVVGIVNPLCASAGYWIGSQCSKLIGVPSGDIGSIGVFMCHVDYSGALARAGVKATFIFAGEHKTEGNPTEPLSDKARAFLQSEVDQTYADFLAAVARGRNTSSAVVRSQFGGGRCFSAPVAKRVGMIDEINTPSLALQSVASLGRMIAFVAPLQMTAEARRRRLALEAMS
ncbi:S49 family peptidase [Bradyrhizobium sp. LjRoot220]|uniref:S49 family peptidase n=1 Tax=Bradyrhizobium sp. LjRoot220 TaxID=3342284 RepID=UPI003ED0ED36